MGGTDAFGLAREEYEEPNGPHEPEMSAATRLTRLPEQQRVVSVRIDEHLLLQR
jgi:hypothetical protein